jgi:hypothetical protein
MSDFTRHFTNLPPELEAIRAKCFHPTGTFNEFKKEEIEQSIPSRLEQPVTTANYIQFSTRLAWAVVSARWEGAEPAAFLLEHHFPIIAAVLGVLKARQFYVQAVHPWNS